MATANVTDLIGISAEMMDRYERDYLRTVTDPPVGLLAYAVGESDGKVRVVRVWDSDE